MDHPITPFVSRMLQMGIDLHMPESQVPMEPSRFELQAELSNELEKIAESLARAFWIMTGKAADATPWEKFSIVLKQRYRYLAERAIATIDPGVRLECQKEAARDLREWIENGPGERKGVVSWEDMANYVLGCYEARLAGVRAEIESDGNR